MSTCLTGRRLPHTGPKTRGPAAARGGGGGASRAGRAGGFLMGASPGPAGTVSAVLGPVLPAMSVARKSRLLPAEALMSALKPPALDTASETLVPRVVFWIVKVLKGSTAPGRPTRVAALAPTPVNRIREAEGAAGAG